MSYFGFRESALVCGGLLIGLAEPLTAQPPSVVAKQPEKVPQPRSIVAASPYVLEESALPTARRGSSPAEEVPPPTDPRIAVASLWLPLQRIALDARGDGRFTPKFVLPAGGAASAEVLPGSQRPWCATVVPYYAWPRRPACIAERVTSYEQSSAPVFQTTTSALFAPAPAAPSDDASETP